MAVKDINYVLLGKTKIYKGDFVKYKKTVCPVVSMQADLKKKPPINLVTIVFGGGEVEVPASELSSMN